MTLEIIAEMMRREAAEHGHCERQLTGGLHLTMRYEEATWYLTMQRQGERPSPKEQATVRNFFNVPQHIKGQYDNSPGGYYLVKLSWTNEDEKPRPKPKKPQQLKLM